MICVKCGQQLNDDSLFCSSCGTKAAEPVSASASDVFCIQCGVKLPEDATFCTECGGKVLPSEESEQDINQEKADYRCGKCGQNLNEDSEFCFSCGAKTDMHTPPQEKEEEQENKAIDNAPPAKVITEKPIAETYLDEPQPPGDTPQNKLVMPLIGVTAVLLIAVIGLVIFIMINRDSTPGNEYLPGPTAGEGQTVGPQDSGTTEISTADYFVQRIRNGHFNNHPGTTIAHALEAYYNNTFWAHFSDGVIDYVSFHGDVQREGYPEPVTEQFIFQFTTDGASFEPISYLVTGAMQDVVLMHEIIDSIVESTR